MRIAAVPLLLVALLTGCAGRGPDQAAGPVTDPVALVGNWQVTGTDEQEGTVLRLGGAADLSLWRRCGMAGGSWRADDTGLFVADAPGEFPCPPESTALAPVPDWLLRATAYRLAGADRELLDDGGEVVARLLPSDEPAPVDPKYVLPELAEPPVVTDEVRQALRVAAPVPAGLTPITPETVVGRWVARDGVRRPDQAGVELSADGKWTSSDGCNRGGGRWIAGAGGTLLATAGGSTDIGCDNHPVGSWVYEARRAAIDGDELVLLDAAAKELGRLQRG